MSASRGRGGEEEAARYLQKSGLRLLERNFRCQGGEIDIIALDGATLVFVEVKARGKNSLGTPFEAVDFRKAARIERAARVYISRKGLYDVCARFDVAGVYLDEDPPRVEIIQNAFAPASSWA